MFALQQDSEKVRVFWQKQNTVDTWTIEGVLYMQPWATVSDPRQFIHRCQQTKIGNWFQESLGSFNCAMKSAYELTEKR